MITGSEASLRYDHEYRQFSNVECIVNTIGDVRYAIQHVFITSNISDDLLGNTTDEHSKCRLLITMWKNSTYRPYCKQDGEEWFHYRYSRSPNITVRIKHLQPGDIVWLLFEGINNSVSLSCANLNDLLSTRDTTPTSTKTVTDKVGTTVATTTDLPSDKNTFDDFFSKTEHLLYFVCGIVGIIVLAAIVILAYCFGRRKKKKKMPESGADDVTRGDNSGKDDKDTYNHIGGLGQKTLPNPNYNHIVPRKSDSSISDDTYDHFRDNKVDNAVNIDNSTYDHIPRNNAHNEVSNDTYNHIGNKRKIDSVVCDTYDHL